MTTAILGAGMIVGQHLDANSVQSRFLRAPNGQDHNIQRIDPYLDQILGADFTEWLSDFGHRKLYRINSLSPIYESLSVGSIVCVF
jgi:hypothetical protein